MYEQIALIIVYAIIGAGLKYIDEIYDTKSFKFKYVYILSTAVGLLMGYVMTIDINSFIILFSVIISVGITGKIDNEAFKLVASLALLLPVFSMIFIPNISINLLPLLLLSIAGVHDEYLDEIGDKRRQSLLTLRPFMKIMIIILCVLGFFEIVYIFAFFSFDIFYSIIGVYSHKKGKKK